MNMRIFFSVFIFGSVIFSAPSSALFTVQKFQRGGQAFTAIMIHQSSSFDQLIHTGNDPTDPIFNSEVNGQSVGLTWIAPEAPGLYDLFFEGKELLKSPDFLEAATDPLFPKINFSEEPITDQLSTYQFLENMELLLLAFAEHHKWKTYAVRGTIPEDIDLSALRQSSKLGGEGKVTILFLDENKNFAGLVAKAWPTATTPILEAEALYTQALEKGLIDPTIPYPDSALNQEDIAARDLLGEIIRTGHVVNIQGASTRWRSVTTELKSLVKKQEFQLDIMAWSVFLFEMFDPYANGTFDHPTRIINNGIPRRAMSPENRALRLSEGSYIGTTHADVFPLHRRVGWKEVARVGDTVFTRMSRESYLNVYARALNREVDGKTFLQDLMDNSLWLERRLHENTDNVSGQKNLNLWQRKIMRALGTAKPDCREALLKQFKK